MSFGARWQSGIDPLIAKRAAKHGQILDSARAKTFRQCAMEYIAAHEDGWRGDKSRRQWVQSLERHVFPKIGALAVGDIDVTAVLSVLDPIARAIPETAGRVKQRIALILDWAAARNLRAHDNPARRRELLPKRKKRPQHFAAMLYQDVASFLVELRERPEANARLLEFQILTATRPGEAAGCRWSEVDGDVWTMPGSRTKSGDPHRIPLSDRAVEILASIPRVGGEEVVFVGRRAGAPLALNALGRLLRRMGHDITAHGFRSCFRTWCEEQTAYPHAVVEAALGHKVSSAVERAYQRSDLLTKRRQLMQAWADYCSSAPASAGEVIPLRGAS